MNTNRIRFGVALGAAALVFASAGPLMAKSATDQAMAGKAKYVFFFVGDGMAMPQVNAAEIFQSASAKSGIAVSQLSDPPLVKYTWSIPTGASSTSRRAS